MATYVTKYFQMTQTFEQHYTYPVRTCLTQPVWVWRYDLTAKQKCVIIIIRLHHSTKYVDAAYCYRPSSVVCLLVGLSVIVMSPEKNCWSSFLWPASMSYTSHFIIHSFFSSSHSHPFLKHAHTSVVNRYPDFRISIDPIDNRMWNRPNDNR